LDNVDPVIVGNIGAPYGVRGWVKINSFTEPSDNLFTYPLLIDTGRGNWQPVDIEQVKAHVGGFVAKLANVDDRDQAVLITNARLAVQRADMPDLDDKQHYWTDIMGLTVYNQDNVLLGNVVDFFATGANDVMVVRGDGDKAQEHLIPYVPEMYVLDVDLSAGQLKVRWDLEL
jgi:16S rRNA processing protein RimM